MALKTICFAKYRSTTQIFSTSSLSGSQNKALDTSFVISFSFLCQFHISLNSVKSSIEVVVTFEDLFIQILNELRCDRLWPIRRHCHYEQVYLLATFSSTLTKSASWCTTAALSFMLMSIIGVCTLRKRNFTTEVTKFSKKYAFKW